MSDFFVYLPSNAITTAKDNTCANFLTNLNEPLELQGEYEVALREIHCPRQFSTFPNAELNIVIAANDKIGLKYSTFASEVLRVRMNNDLIITIKPPIENTIKTKQYYNTTSLVNDLNEYYKKAWKFMRDSMKDETVTTFHKEQVIINKNRNKNATINYEFSESESEDDEDKHKDKDVVYWKEGKCQLGAMTDLNLHINSCNPYISKDLHEALGFPALFNEHKTGNFTYKYAEHNTYNFSATEMKQHATVKQRKLEFSQIYIYTDIVKPQRVSASRFQILRVIDIPDSGKNIVLRFLDSYYIPLQNNNITSINIELKFDDGSVCNFMEGRTLIVLHFKKIK